jgi:hypothetical protein
MPLAIEELTKDFAVALQSADSKQPVWVTRKSRSYEPGIGPHPEGAAVALVLAEMREASPERYAACDRTSPTPILAKSAISGLGLRCNDPSR